MITKPMRAENPQADPEEMQRMRRLIFGQHLPDDEKMIMVLSNLKMGASVVQACKAVGVNRGDFYFWTRMNDTNRAAYFEIMDSRSGDVEDALFKNAMEGNATCQIFWLKNRIPNRWKDRIEVDAKFSEPSSEEKGLIRRWLEKDSKSRNVLKLIHREFLSTLESTSSD